MTNWEIVKLIVIILFVSYAVYFIYRQFKKNMPLEKFSEPKLKIVLFYAVWCPHCEDYLSSKVFSSTYEELKKNPKYASVVFEELDYDKNKSVANKYNVSSFPSIIAVSSEERLIDTFNGDRYDRDVLKAFVDKSLRQV